MTEPKRWKRAVNQCLECGRFLKAYGDGWDTGIHVDCDPRRNPDGSYRKHRSHLTHAGAP